MPFFQNIYHPLSYLPSSPRSLKMPGYLASPVQYASFPYVTMSPKSSGIQTFRFQPRRDGIDWRRFSAIDVERVARELDISTLQESINSITFCNLDGERCPYCQQSVDPVLLKVLKMAQMTIEYLLHCQECLSTSVAQLEERVQEAAAEHQQTKEELVKQGEELKKIKEESRRRKKLIGTQQLLLQSGANNYHKCQLCDKAFMNYSYLQEHHQRRHPEVTEAERQKKKQVEQMEDGIEDLKSKLQKTRSQLDAEREIEHQRRMQEAEEARRREEDGKRDFERWKEEERIKFQDEIDRLRKQFLSQLQDITIKNSTFESRFQDLEVKKLMTSNLGTLEDEEDRREQQKELWSLREEMERQRTEWKNKLKDIQREHTGEKEELVNENERLRASMSHDQRATDQQIQRQVQSLRSQIKDQSRVIKSQDQTIKNLTAHREAREVMPVDEAKADESTEDELDESLDRTLKRIEDLRMNPDFIRQFRPILEETLMEKLESIGVKKGAKGIPSHVHKNLKSLVSTQLEQKVRKYPEIPTLRVQLSKKLTRRVKQWRKNEGIFQSPSSKISDLSLKSPRSQVPSEPVTPRVRNVQIAESRQILAKAPAPSPQSKEMARQNASNITNVAPPLRPRTPPFTSEEDSSVTDHSYFPSPTQKASQGLQVIQPNPRVQKQIEEDSDDDWSNSDISPGKPSPRSVTFSTGMTAQGSLVHSMTRSLEKQLSRPREKPVAGVEIISSQPSKSPNKFRAAEKFQSSYDSDSEISSLEDITENQGIRKRKPQPAVRHSADSQGSQGTSVWSSSSTRADVW
ncbi:cilium assembly protein DZIP1L isoform X2 [Ascaphus truei]|uniref:cilium assembly protein DZIP1L isoform X2 n=1 Tax=Ascaphus truei TaxID=8439 RepID=UPI003F5A493A